MRVFEVKESSTHSGTGQPGEQWQWHQLGRSAPGAGVLVVREGSGWVVGAGGIRQPVTPKSVIVWDEGDWVEYGGHGHFEVEEYWAVAEPEGAAEARLQQFFSSLENEAPAQQP